MTSMRMTHLQKGIQDNFGYTALIDVASFEEYLGSSLSDPARHD